jgi:hypothetical protein
VAAAPALLGYLETYVETLPHLIQACCPLACRCEWTMLLLCEYLSSSFAPDPPHSRIRFSTSRQPPVLELFTCTGTREDSMTSTGECECSVMLHQGTPHAELHAMGHSASSSPLLSKSFSTRPSMPKAAAGSKQRHCQCQCQQ